MAKVAEGRRALVRVAELEQENERLRGELAAAYDAIQVAEDRAASDVSRETEGDVSRETAARKSAPRTKR
jgi:hypothetical protein